MVVTRSPGWGEVKAAFFDWGIYKDSFPDILHAFWLNVKLFCVAEVLILAAALLIAVLRRLPGPVFFPIRALAIAYTDLFRGIPTILVISILGFGMPALGLSGLPTSEFFWARRRARARVHRLRVRGVPRGHRLGAPEPGGRRALARPLARPVAALRRPPAGRAPGDPAAPQRLHRPAEGHRARRHARRRRGVQAGADRRVRDVQFHAVPRRRDALRR